ncbi:MAG: hypothetical protein IID49_00815 [Proteobacteria bacterium]|nr:hypothetical protein [Pseudomonadota bacterium]
MVDDLSSVKIDPIESLEADPDAHALGVGEIATLVGAVGSASKIGKELYNLKKPKVPLRVVIKDCFSISNERHLIFEINNASHHTVYLEEIGVEGICKTPELKLDSLREKTIGHEPAPLISDKWHSNGAQSLPLMLEYDKSSILHAIFTLNWSGELYKNNVRKLLVGYCWLSDKEPTRCLRVDFALRWDGYFQMPT